MNEKIISLVISFLICIGSAVATWTALNSRLSVVEANVQSIENTTNKEVLYIRDDLKEIKQNLQEIQKTLRK